MQDSISAFLGFKKTASIGKSLGAPIIHGRRSKRYFQSLLDKVRDRLASWKSLSLALAGRLTLARSVLTSLPMTNMQTCDLPSGINQELDQIVRDFLWGSSTEARKMHHVSWRSICQPKDRGGLGLRSASDRNTVLLLKLGWRYLTVGTGLEREVCHS